MNDPRGSVWRKWDLHVHTPASVHHNYRRENAWDAFLADLEALPDVVQVLGINDYIFLDGFRKVAEAKRTGRLPKIQMILPVIELRLDKFGGSPGHLSKVNYHVIFSNELNADIIEQHFINALTRSFTLSPAYEPVRRDWQALPTRASLEDLGRRIVASVPESERTRFGSPLEVGFDNISFQLDAIQKALDSHYFKDKHLTAVGKTEWYDIKWNDHSVADKKTIINGCDLVFISAPNIPDYNRALAHLRDSGVNSRLMDCSDAHHFSDSDQKDRIGKCFTWVKADPTFEGLHHAVKEFSKRVFVGDAPEKMQRAEAHRTKFIRSMKIEKVAGASLDEHWFGQDVPIGPDLVAIIGNKGSGKSALADIMGLAGNSHQEGRFSFLNEQRFRDPVLNKARSFQATLGWLSDTADTRNLADPVDSNSPEKVRYIPQHFFEEICTEIGTTEESQFDKELKDVIFSRVPEAERLGQDSLDSLISYKTREVYQAIEILQGELRTINEKIAKIESYLEPEFRARYDNLLRVKTQELEAHEKAIPQAPPEPQLAAQTKAAAAEMERAESALQEIRKLLDAERTKQNDLTKKVAAAKRLKSTIDNFHSRFEKFASECREDCDLLGLALDQLVTLKVNTRPLDTANDDLQRQKAAVDSVLDPEVAGSLANKEITAKDSVEKLRAKLDEPSRLFQKYKAELVKWEARKKELIGDAKAKDSIEYCKHVIGRVDQFPLELEELLTARRDKARSIHERICELANTYRELYKPVQDFIQTHKLVQRRFDFRFEVAIVNDGFQSGFFELINRQVRGSFCGVQEGEKVLHGITVRHDFANPEAAVVFADEIVRHLKFDLRSGQEDANLVPRQMRQGHSVSELYDYVFGFEYLKPRYTLHLANKELKALSAGERGALLLIFYLLVDKSDVPLIIDQPEENLDNESVYELLVPCIQEAKEHRQIIVVTHNPNIAVVCDAEQVIYAHLDKNDRNRVTYTTGAIENPVLNKKLLDVLEGTRPAFDNRSIKYLPEKSVT